MATFQKRTEHFPDEEDIASFTFVIFSVRCIEVPVMVGENGSTMRELDP
jgi:hypothetical protein